MVPYKARRSQIYGLMTKIVSGKDEELKVDSTATRISNKALFACLHCTVPGVLLLLLRYNDPFSPHEKLEDPLLVSVAIS